ncbi:hypothetical protein D3C81_1682820 [compost metagenome]
MLFYRFQGDAQPLGDFGLRYLVQLVHDEYCLAARWQVGNGSSQPVQRLRGVDLALLGCGVAGDFGQLRQRDDQTAPPTLATAIRDGIIVSDLAQ